LQKLNEEVDELKNELLVVYAFDDMPSDHWASESKKIIVDELCDVIEVLHSMANQIGIDGNMIQAGIHDTNKKLKERGCI
jgi:NTP pyrophosphatase (non-canonical NTP hydrolase)